MGTRYRNGNGISRASLPSFNTCMQENPWTKCELSDRRVRADV